jgi:hypothetical protein
MDVSFVNANPEPFQTTVERQISYIWWFGSETFLVVSHMREDPIASRYTRIYRRALSKRNQTNK